MTLRLILSFTLALGALIPARAIVRIESNFDENLDGWSVTGDATEPVWRAEAEGADGGCAEASDRGTGEYWYWSAPPKFLGDRRYAYGQFLRFSIWESDTGALSTAIVPDIILKGDNITLVRSLPGISPGHWSGIAIRLSEGVGWRVSSLFGPVADAPTIRQVLANLASLEIRGEYISGPDTGRLDSVVMELSQAPDATAMPVVSDFNIADDHWTVFGDVQGGSSKPTYRATGGVDNTGYVEAKDDVQGGVWYWGAPPKFLGNIQNAFGQSLTFSLYQSSMANQFSAPDLIVESAEARLVYRFRYHPNTRWTPYVVPMAPGPNWHVGDLDGPQPDSAQFQAALALVTGLYIRGEFVTGPDTDGLDSVVLGAPRVLDGDMNGDDAIGLPDVVWLLKRIAGLEPTTYGDVTRGDLWPLESGDMGDGKLDLLDALAVARRIG